MNTTQTGPAGQIGVFLTPAGWTWKCGCGAEAEGAVPDRVAARDAYKIHRRSPSHAQPQDDTPTPTPQSPSEEDTPVPVTERKKATKKATKKKGAKRTAKKKATKKKGAAKKKAGGPKTWCFAKLTNSKGKKVFPRLGGNGMLDRAAAERLGVQQQQDVWYEVQAVTQKEATAMVRKGGQKVTLAQFKKRKSA